MSNPGLFLEIEYISFPGGDKILVRDVAETAISVEADVPSGLGPSDFLGILSLPEVRMSTLNDFVWSMEALFLDGMNEITVPLKNTDDPDKEVLVPCTAYAPILIGYPPATTKIIRYCTTASFFCTGISPMLDCTTASCEQFNQIDFTTFPPNLYFFIPDGSSCYPTPPNYDAATYTGVTSSYTIESVVTDTNETRSLPMDPVNPDNVVLKIETDNTNTIIDYTLFEMSNPSNSVEFVDLKNAYNNLLNPEGITVGNTYKAALQLDLVTPSETQTEKIDPGQYININIPLSGGGDPTLGLPEGGPRLRCSDTDATNDSVTLFWQGISGLTYRLFRGNNLISELPGINGQMKFIDTGLMANSSNTYELRVIGDNMNEFLDLRSTVECATICILPGATVLTPNGKKLIDNIVAGDIVIDENGNHVTVIHNIRSGPSKRKVVRFDKGCFGSQKPDAPITITTGHPIKRRPNTKEAVVESYINHGLIQSRFMKLSHTFTLMTKQRCFVMTNGIPVATYSEADFEKECQKMRAAGTPLLYQLL